MTGQKSKGKPALHTSVRNRLQLGSKHPCWKGGKYVDHHGYVMVNVRYGRSGKKSGWYNYRKEHVVVMERKLGRALTKGEVVHHIDGDKTNNKLSNLWLTTYAGHRKAHVSLQALGYRLVRAGLVRFDRRSGIYRVKKELEELIHERDR